MTTKLQQVQQYIADAGRIDLHAIVLDLEVSPSTVRRAVAALKAIGAIDAAGRYVGRAFVPPAELRAALERRTDDFNYLTLTRETRAALSAELHLANERALIQSLQWAAPRVALEVDFSSFYGWLVKLLPARAA